MIDYFLCDMVKMLIGRILEDGGDLIIEFGT